LRPSIDLSFEDDLGRLLRLGNGVEETSSPSGLGRVWTARQEANFALRQHLPMAPVAPTTKWELERMALRSSFR
jgi:hypothetical protein